MDCDDCLERLYPYLDRALTAEEVRTVKTHLDACTDCSSHFHFEELFLSKIREACVDERAPDRLRASIVLRLRQG